MAKDFDQLSSAFLDEFQRISNSHFHKGVRIVDLRGSGRGRGIVAAADIPAETELFTIPREYVISVENSRLYKLLPQLFQSPGLTSHVNDDNDDDIMVVESDGEEARDGKPDEREIDDEDANSSLSKPWLDLILVLVHDYLHRETSKWKAYWDVLPESFDTLMFWSEAELAELQASTVRGRIGKASADRMFTSHVIPVIRKHIEIFDPNHGSIEDGKTLSEEDLLKLCHRMGSLIMAYAFDLQTTDDDEDDEDEKDDVNAEDGWVEDKQTQTAMGMVPMADMLNADAEFNAHLEHGDDSLTMRSLRTIKQGEEVLNYYGPLGNGDLARRYGYTSKLHSRHDVVEISWDLISQVIRQHFDNNSNSQAMEKMLNDENDELEESFVLERETGDPDETGIHTTKAKFTTFPEELVEQVTMFARAGLDLNNSNSKSEKKRKFDNNRNRNKDEDKIKLKRAFLQIMAKVIPLRLAQFSTIVEEDDEKIQEILHKSNQTDDDDDDDIKVNNNNLRLTMALEIRAGEKRLLKEAEDLVRVLLVKYDDDDDRKDITQHISTNNAGSNYGKGGDNRNIHQNKKQKLGER